MKGISSCTGNIIVWNFFLYRILPSVQEISSRNKCLSTWKMTCCDTEFPPSSWDRKLPTVTRNFFLWQEISSYDKKFLPVTRNFFLWQDISSCDKKFLPVTRNFFLWQEISSYYKKSSCGKKVLPMKQENIFGLQKSIGLTGTFCFILHEIPSCQICDKYAWISANISCEPEDFMGTWLPGSPGISHLGWNVPVNNSLLTVTLRK